jgi:hypothetical protein
MPTWLKPLKKRWDRLLGRRDVPGMVSQEERAFCEAYAGSEYTGAGALVELGCWLGSCSAALARGLVRNPRRQTATRSLDVFDRFLWQGYMEAVVVGTSWQGRFSAGGSFLPGFRQLTAPWAERICVHDGDLLTARWDGGPIEFLLIDVMKSAELAVRVVREFFPALMPGSVIVQQDFAHYYTPWIHLIHSRLRDHFTTMRDLPNSCGQVFRLNCPLSADRFTDMTWLTHPDPDAIRDAFDHSRSLTSAGKHPRIDAAEVMMAIHLGDWSMARATWHRHHTSAADDADFAAVTRLLEQHDSSHPQR